MNKYHHRSTAENWTVLLVAVKSNMMFIDC